jgi:peroxiredoxin
MRKTYVMASRVAIVAIALAARGFANESESGIAIGMKAPDFSLEDQDGKTVSLHNFAGKTVVLEWTNPNCPFVQRHYREKTMQTLSDQYKDKGVAWLAINSSFFATDDQDKQWVTGQSISYPVLNDSSGGAGHAYNATNTPDMFIVGADGKVAYEGAIDNDPTDEKTGDKINYVHQALDEILAGKSVSVPQTKPYGCNVKYKD